MEIGFIKFHLQIWPQYFDVGQGPIENKVTGPYQINNNK